jgi:signal recognition particle subunit SRP19
MANHARIEEVSDSDSDADVMDPDEGDIMDLATFTSSNTFKGPRVVPPNQNQTLTNPSNIPSTAQRQPPPQPQYDPAKSKHWHCIYPIYFDASKTRDEGRRVGRNGAVKNPLARTILEAVARLGLNVVFEPQKIHPKDWANPGRVRVELKDENGRIKRPNVKNSMSTQTMLQNSIPANHGLSRTPSISSRLIIPKRQPNDGRFAYGTPNTRHAHA